MKLFNSFYNNEAIASIALGYFIKIHKVSEISKLFLVLPFVLHEPSLRKLKGNSYKRSLEEFIVKNSECIINFNTRYIDCLTLTINALTILQQAQIIHLKDNNVYYNNQSQFLPGKAIQHSKRAYNICKAINELDVLLKQDTASAFYSKLKIEL
jgi:hypothetical protein